MEKSREKYHRHRPVRGSMLNAVPVMESAIPYRRRGSSSTCTIQRRRERWRRAVLVISSARPWDLQRGEPILTLGGREGVVERRTELDENFGLGSGGEWSSPKSRSAPKGSG
jgi:hypothetical protein